MPWYRGGVDRNLICLIDIFRQLDIPFAFAHWALSTGREVAAMHIIGHLDLDLAFPLRIDVRTPAPRAIRLARSRHLPVGNAEAPSQQARPLFNVCASQIFIVLHAFVRSVAAMMVPDHVHALPFAPAAGVSAHAPGMLGDANGRGVAQLRPVLGRMPASRLTAMTTSLTDIDGRISQIFVPGYKASTSFSLVGTRLSCPHVLYLAPSLAVWSALRRIEISEVREVVAYLLPLISHLILVISRY